MPNRCIVGGCSRTSKDKSASFHQFPKKENQRHKWIQFVRLTRTDFTGPGLSHTHRSSLVCNAHFEDSCYILQWNNKPRLTDTAVPTKLPAGSNTASTRPRRRLSRYLRDKYVSASECLLCQVCAMYIIMNDHGIYTNWPNCLHYFLLSENV